MRTRATAVSFLLLILLTIAGYYPVFLLDQYAVRKQVKLRIKQGIPEEDLHLVEAKASTRTRMVWIREGREFALDNQMFDVVRLDSAHGIVRYFCVLDTEETILFARLSKVVENEIDNAIRRCEGGTAAALKLLRTSQYLPVAALRLPLIVTLATYPTEESSRYSFLYLQDIPHPPSHC